MVKKNSIIYQCYVNLLARHPCRRHHCSCHHRHCPLCCLPPSLPLPSSSLSPSPSPLPLLAHHPRCCHHHPLCHCCSQLTRNPCCHCHCLVALTLFVTCHPHCHRHCPCSPCPFPLCHLPGSLPLPLLSPSPSPPTLNAIAIALATIAIALFVARHPHCRGHCPICCRCRCSPTTVVAIAIALFASATIHGDCHCAVAAVLPLIAPPLLTAIGIVLPLSLCPIVTSAVAHCHHRHSSLPPPPIAITLPSRRPLRIAAVAHCNCAFIVPAAPQHAGWLSCWTGLSLHHLHANRNWVVMSHLFPAMDISVTALSVAAAIFLGTVVQ
jgi:hypothetical protein